MSGFDLWAGPGNFFFWGCGLSSCVSKELKEEFDDGFSLDFYLSCGEWFFGEEASGNNGSSSEGGVLCLVISPHSLQKFTSSCIGFPASLSNAI